MKISKPLFCIGIKDTKISSSATERMKKHAALQIIASIYFDKSSKFYNTLYSENLVSPSLTCWIQHNKAFSFFMLNGDSDNPNKVYSEFLEYTKKATSSPININDFERCRRSLYSKFIKLFDNTEDIATELVTGFAVDGGNIFEFARILKKITPLYTEKVLKNFFCPDAYALSVILPV